MIPNDMAGSRSNNNFAADIDKDKDKPAALLHTCKPLRRTPAYRVFMTLYTCAIVALLYRHVQSSIIMFSASNLPRLFMSICMALADMVLAGVWFTTQSYRVRPVRRSELTENLKQENALASEIGDFPALDVFVCTADPHKEPPMNVVNTALSVMAYDYHKISVYVSDDGGSQLTLFAFVEAAKFATAWLPFCRMNNLTQRSPEEFFKSSSTTDLSADGQRIRAMYESMKSRVETAVDKGQVGLIQLSDQDRCHFLQWTDNFTRRDHPTVIKVLLDSVKDKDTMGQAMPNLVYLSRQKSGKCPHHFKAGALNTLLRVSAAMTNAPIILTQDCDMYSNDPTTVQRVLCYFLDSSVQPTLGYVQFPQRFHGINKNDTYACEHIRLFQINPLGMDGLAGPNYVGSGCFFSRRAFFGGPATMVPPEIPQLSPTFSVDKPIDSQSVLTLAHDVAACNYENDTKWGSQIGFRYGSLVEDYYTGYRLQCQGWKSVFCNPRRAAFLGDVPITLNDMLSQNKRWNIGLCEVLFSKYSPITHGVKSMGLLMGLSYSHYAFWPILCVPLTIYVTLPQLALLNSVPIFPKASDPWFLLYAFLFTGAYLQDFAEFILEGSTFGRWWNDQRMWMAKGLTCHPFGLTEFLLKAIGITVQGFSLTSKALDEEQSKRYDQGLMEFGLPSSMFLSLSTAAILSLVSLSSGLMQIIVVGANVDDLFGQMLLAGFAVINCWPVYEAILLRTDKGRMPAKTVLISTCIAWALCTAASLALRPRV